MSGKMTDQMPTGVLSTPLQLMGGGAPPEPQPPESMRPRGLLRQLEKGFLHLDRLVGRLVPEQLNPLLHTGAIAVTSFLVALVTGVVLLIWYRPSVHLAWASVEAMSAAPLTGGLMRSLHRYSSDACMAFAIVHMLRIVVERRFGGTRWLAWVTGVAMLGILWLTGWTGYWLVWDLRAQSVALGTARAFDVLPIFADPLSRSFITDEGVNSLLFFVVFFVHMLIPLAMGVIMWIHITRLARPRFLTTRPMTAWVMGALLLLCLLYPAASAGPAAMTALPQDDTIDWWYLFPLLATDRLGGGAIWALALVPGVVLFSLPWWLERRRRAPATVVQSRCNECMKCFQDCPYEAIEMVPRDDGSAKYLNRASVIASKCVSCGICAGSCDTAGIGVDWFGSIDQRRRIEAWLLQAETAGESVSFAFACAESAGGALEVDPMTGRCKELPDHLVMTVPCAGWVHPLLIERAIRNGAKSVLIAACGPGECRYREGARWEQQRLEGAREPVLRLDKLGETAVQMLELARTRKRELVREATRLHGRAGGAGGAGGAGRGPAWHAIGATLIALLSAGLLGWVSDAGYSAPTLAGSELVVSIKHPGAVSENCRDLSDEELAATPVHMRKKHVCERARVAVRLRVEVDDARAIDASLAPSGIWHDGNSVAIERIDVATGHHRVRVAIGETDDPDEWTFSEEQSLDFTSETRRVVAFDRVSGFVWR